MRVLFTGASSFTGYWFVRELAAAGHDVVAVFRQQPDAYGAARAKRVQALRHLAQCCFEMNFGDSAFLSLVREQSPFDLLCHHAADAANYKSPDFDVLSAVANNTQNLNAVLHALINAGCCGMVLTGSLFEAGEGAGSTPLRAFNPYGLSKTVSATIVADACERLSIPFGKFVIPNPFGPFEEPRFTHYLMEEWFRGRIPVVRTPRYVRDNIHVDLLAKAYVRFAEAVMERPGDRRTCHPSGYISSQGVFAGQVSAAMAERLGWPCPVILAEQTGFDEPAVRVNTEPVDGQVLGWSETAAWDGMAAWYEAYFRQISF